MPREDVPGVHISSYLLAYQIRYASPVADIWPTGRITLGLQSWQGLGHIFLPV